MRGRTARDEDSGSDWDSISEIVPPPPPKKQESQLSSQSDSQNQPAVAARKLKPLTRMDPHLGNKADSENPPYSFRSEVKSPSRVSEDHITKPGKQKKGKLYDPRPPSQRRVSFVDDEAFDQERPSANGDVTGPDSDVDDPLYSTVKPREASNPEELQTQDEQGKEDESSHKSEKKKFRSLSKSLNKKLQGIDNRGYVDDDEAAGSHSTHSTTVAKKSSTTTPVYVKPHTLANQQLPSEIPKNFHRCEEGFKPEAYYVKSNSENSLLVNMDWSPPLILTIGETPLESEGKKALETINRAMGEVFALVTFPFTCFTLFLHHLLRLSE
ncbi:hepatoma-derived growth factor-related protein 2-like isoform X2 [Cherax quadricarinatus]|uniref:hepatoma-derived growth factor-related protein 2-like isoform X2 n=1 Tax=Cherax quadricarinatus TaxID=27406 RepID=UPI002379A598|nr:uncharacterized protein LOC128697005 isoform X2 [Cherax quadricarinatus]